MQSPPSSGGIMGFKSLFDRRHTRPFSRSKRSKSDTPSISNLVTPITDIDRLISQQMASPKPKFSWLPSHLSDLHVTDSYNSDNAEKRQKPANNKTARKRARSKTLSNFPNGCFSQYFNDSYKIQYQKSMTSYDRSESMPNATRFDMESFFKKSSSLPTPEIPETTDINISNNRWKRLSSDVFINNQISDLEDDTSGLKNTESKPTMVIKCDHCDCVLRDAEVDRMPFNVFPNKRKPSSKFFVPLDDKSGSDRSQSRSNGSDESNLNGLSGSPDMCMEKNNIGDNVSSIGIPRSNNNRVLVCHHPGCMERNGDKPLLLCDQCDRDIHSLPQNNGHLVLDASSKDLVMGGTRNKSVRCSHSDNEIDVDEDETDGMYVKKSSTSGSITSSTSSASKFDHMSGERESKLRRKKALKGRRHHTDVARFSTFYCDSDIPPFHVPDTVDGPKLSVDSADNASIQEELLSPSPSIQSESNFDYSDVPSIASEDGQQESRRNSKGKSLSIEEENEINLNNECITLYFTLQDGTLEKEVICALKNILLRDALIPLVENHKMDIERVNVYVEKSKTPLPINCETFLLGGNSLYIKQDKPEQPLSSRTKSLPNISGKITTATNNKQLHKTASVTTKRRAMNLSIDDVTHTNVVPATSPHGTWTSDSGKKAQRSQSKLTNLFTPVAKDKEKYDQLSDTLSSYVTDGLPSMPNLMAIGQPEVDESVFELESHWSSIVDNASSLSKRQHDHQEAIWELLQTEVHYIRSIRVIADVFMCVLLNLQQDLLLNEIETERMFSNISAIIEANTEFWTTVCVNVVTESRASHLPFNASLLKDGFKKFGEIFKPYTKYCLDQKPCSDYMKSVYNDNELFKSFVVWAETQPLCNRLKLTDLLVKPMQRLTKYSLLLQAILRKTDDERQRRDLLEMISQVDKFVLHVNTTLRQKHEQERLATIVSKIESYDAVEPPNDECKELMAEYCNPPDLWRCMPHCSPSVTRSLVMQSSLKMKDTQSRVDVECLLFTDMLLICKANKRLDKYRIIKPPMRVDRIIVQELRDKCSFLLILLNEYRVPVWAVTFHADMGSTRIWLEYIKKAQDLYLEAKTAHRLFSIPRTTVTPSTVPKSGPDDKLLIKNLDKGMPPRQRSHTLSDSDQELNQKSALTLSPEIDTNVDEDPLSESDVAIEVDKSVKTTSTIHSSTSLPSMATPAVITTESDDETTEFSVTESLHSLADNMAETLVDKNRQNYKDGGRRNSRSERRYHTADSIQELEQKNRDPTIYKRLSWNVGSVDMNVHRLESTKAISSDSLRSFHSSSGVSSTGSLHYMFDGEVLSEDLSETESVKADTIRSTSSNMTLMDLDDSLAVADELTFNSDINTEYTNNDLNVNNTNTMDNDLSYVADKLEKLDNNHVVKIDTRPNNEINTALQTDRTFYDNTNNDEIDYKNRLRNNDLNSSLNIPTKTKSLDRCKTEAGLKSLSTSDISAMLNNISFSEKIDGIKSVELPKVSEKRHLSYARRQKMKQLLLTSEVEASEV